ncbi:MAG: hypothetical protein ABI142_01540, partial [Bryocella sp.]
MGFNRRKFVQLATAAIAAPVVHKAETTVPAAEPEWKPNSLRPKNVVLMNCSSLESSIGRSLKNTRDSRE